MLFALSISFCLLVQAIHGQPGGKPVDCKCGGTYGNGRAVTGCNNGRCQGNPGQSTKCVVIYRETTAIGYDCLSWPAQVADCATFDDGSRVCANDVCKPSLLGGFEGDCALSDDQDHHVLVAAQISKKGLDFAIAEARRRGEIEVTKLAIPDQAFTGGGYEVKANSIKLEQFKMPIVTYQLIAPSSIRVQIKGGDFKVCAKWSAKAAFIPASGDLCVWSEKQKGVDVDLTVSVSVDNKGKIKVSSGGCKIDVPVDLKMTGAIGAIISVISGAIETKIESTANTEGCKAIDTQVRTTLAKILDGLPQSYKIDEKISVAYTLQSVNVNDLGIKAQLATNGTFTPVSPVTSTVKPK